MLYDKMYKEVKIMEDYIVYIAIGSVLLTIISIIILVVNKKEYQQKNRFDLAEILPLFDNDNILNIEFIRNKIVVYLKDINDFDAKMLHLKGAIGITVVGNKIKFYVSDSIEVNEEVYNKLKEFIEGK